MRTFAEVDDQGRISTKSPWYSDASTDAKSVPGAKWDPATKTWNYPLTLEVCRALRATYGDRLDIGPKLWEWAAATVAHEKRLLQLGAASDAELRVVPARFTRMAEAMGARTYQRAGARFVATARRAVILDEPGLGKTVTSIAGIIEAGKWSGSHLVVSNKTSLFSVWGDQLVRWTDGAATVFVCDGTVAQRKKTFGEFVASTAESKWLVVNPAMLEIKREPFCKKCGKFESDLNEQDDIEHWTMAHKMKKEIRNQKYPEIVDTIWDAVIVDEAHKLLTTGIKSSQKYTQSGDGAMQLRVKEDGVKIAMTATPARGKEINLWGLFYWLWPETYGSKWDWVKQFFNSSSNGFGIDIAGVREDKKEDFWRMIDRHSLRRTRKEVRGELPDGQVFEDWVPLKGKHAKQYSQMERLGAAELESGKVEAVGILAEMTRLKQMAWGEWDMSGGQMLPTLNSPKLERLMDLLDRRGVTGDPKTEFKASETHYKYIIASQFTQIVDLVEKHLNGLGIPTVKVTGAVTGNRRAEAVRSFQDDPDGARVMVLNTQAGGESITLDKYCDTIFILDETFVADDQVQLHGRIDNRSVASKDAVPRQYIYIHTKDTIEEGIAMSNIDQLQMEHNLLDRRRMQDMAIQFTRRKFE